MIFRLDESLTQDGFPIDTFNSGLERSPGLHLTDVIRDIAGVLFPKQKVSRDNCSWNREATMGMGFLWECALSDVMRDKMAHRIGEVECDGIMMSPDGVDWGNGVLEEYKCTWKSTRHPPEDNWEWMTQIKGYLWGIGKGEMTRVVMRVLYVMGDWKGGGPEYRVWRGEFEEWELRENWEMIVNHAKARGWV